MKETTARFVARAANVIDRLTIGRISLDDQYRLPRGLRGRLVGASMARQHDPENEWTVAVLAPEQTDSVLEIGFGSGTTIARLAAATPEGFVTGIDASTEMVRAAARRNRRAIRAGRVRLLHGEAARLPFPEQSFDKVVSVHVLYFWPDPLQVLREAWRVLKPGGRLAITFMPRERWPNQGAGATCGVFAGEEVAAMLREAGFRDAQVVPGDPARFREIAVLATR